MKTSNKYIYWIAWRNIIRRDRKNSLSVMTKISIVSIAVGVGSLIVVLSVMAGLAKDLEGRMLKGNPHLAIIGSNKAAGFSLKDLPIKKLKKLFPESIEAEPYTKSDVVLKQGKHMTTATIFGVSDTYSGKLWGFKKGLIDGNLKSLFQAQKRGVIIGIDLARQLGTDLGEDIVVISPQSSISNAMGGGTISRKYTITGLFSTGLFDHDSKWAIVNINEGRKFLPDYDYTIDEDKYVTGVAMTLKEPRSVSNLVKRYINYKSKNSELLSETAPESWEMANRSYLYALKLEKFAMTSILFLIVLVAAFSVSGTMMMTVFYKRGQGALLRALGFSSRNIRKLYVTQGVFIGLQGVLWGLGLGILLCLIIKSLKSIPLPEGVYHLKYLPCKWLPLEYSIICIVALLLSFIAAYFPAKAASNQNPSQGLSFL